MTHCAQERTWEDPIYILLSSFHFLFTSTFVVNIFSFLKHAGPRTIQFLPLPVDCISRVDDSGECHFDFVEFDPN